MTRTTPIATMAEALFNSGATPDAIVAAIEAAEQKEKSDSKWRGYAGLAAQLKTDSDPEAKALVQAWSAARAEVRQAFLGGIGVFDLFAWTAKRPDRRQ